MTRIRGRWRIRLALALARIESTFLPGPATLTLPLIDRLLAGVMVSHDGGPWVPLGGEW